MEALRNRASSDSVGGNREGRGIINHKKHRENLEKRRSIDLAQGKGAYESLLREINPWSKIEEER